MSAYDEAYEEARRREEAWDEFLAARAEFRGVIHRTLAGWLGIELDPKNHAVAAAVFFAGITAAIACVPALAVWCYGWLVLAPMAFSAWLGCQWGRVTAPVGEEEDGEDDT